MTASHGRQNEEKMIAETDHCIHRASSVPMGKFLMCAESLSFTGACWSEAASRASPLQNPQGTHEVLCFAPQLEDLNKGTFGFVQLAYDRVMRQQVAIKFIERGDKVGAHTRMFEQSWSLAQETLPAAMQRGAPGSKPHIPFLAQVTKYVQREILNHRRLIHPHIVEMREVRAPLVTSGSQEL